MITSTCFMDIKVMKRQKYGEDQIPIPIEQKNTITNIHTLNVVH
jgi:hypothetical protein